MCYVSGTKRAVVDRFEPPGIHQAYDKSCKVKQSNPGYILLKHMSELVCGSNIPKCGDTVVQSTRGLPFIDLEQIPLHETKEPRRKTLFSNLRQIKEDICPVHLVFSLGVLVRLPHFWHLIKYEQPLLNVYIEHMG